MIHNAAEGFQPQAALSQTFVAVFVAGKGVLAVVQVQGVQPVKADHPVKFRQYAVQVIHDVVAAVVDVAGVQAYPHIFASHGVQDVL